MSVRNQLHQQQQKQEPAQASSKAWGEGQKAGVPLFQLGQLVATPAALEFLATIPCGVLPLVARHVRGDFGDLCDEDRELNKEAIQYGSRVLSSYQFDGGKVWIITEADRSVTTVLLPSDY